MSVEEIIRLIFSFLGGGLIVGLLNLWYAGRSESKARRIDFIRSQLQELYGPLQFFASCNAKLLDLTKALNDAYIQEYEETQWSRREATQDRLRQAASQTLDIINQYMKQVQENNEHILTILESHYSLSEPPDIEHFDQFIVDNRRLKTEVEECGRVELKTPLEIYQHLDKIALTRAEFIEAVDMRFNEKKAELQKLLK